MDNISKKTYIIAALAFVLILAAIYFLFVFQKKAKVTSQDQTAEDVKKIDDIPLAKRPFVTFTPTTDGAEVIFSMKNMAEFSRIEYEFTYQADNPQVAGEKIERGSTGTDVDPKAPEYKKSILLGTASKGVRSPDKNVSDGKLTLHLFKGDTEYQSESTWNMMKVGISSTTLTSASNNFKIEFPKLDKDYWAIAAETVGLPPNSPDIDSSKVSLPNYGAFAILPKLTRNATVSIIASNDVSNPVLFAYNLADDRTQKIDSKYDSSSKTLTAQVDSLSAFVVSSAK